MALIKIDTLLQSSHWVLRDCKSPFDIKVFPTFNIYWSFKKQKTRPYQYRARQHIFFPSWTVAPPHTAADTLIFPDQDGDYTGTCCGRSWRPIIGRSAFLLAVRLNVLLLNGGLYILPQAADACIIYKDNLKCELQWLKIQHYTCQGTY